MMLTLFLKLGGGGGQNKLGEGKHAKLCEGAKLGEGCQKVRLGQDSLPNIAISTAETSGKWGRCFTRTPNRSPKMREGGLPQC